MLSHLLNEKNVFENGLKSLIALVNGNANVNKNEKSDENKNVKGLLNATSQMSPYMTAIQAVLSLIQLLLNLLVITTNPQQLTKKTARDSTAKMNMTTKDTSRNETYQMKSGKR